MKNYKLLPGFIFLTLLLLISCNKQEYINSTSGEPSEKIVIDQNSQIPLKETVLSTNEINEISCGKPTKVTLFAGQHIDVGTLTVTNDTQNLYIRYDLTGDWLLSETHLFVGAEEDLPLNGGQNPKIGHFPYHGTHGLVSSYTFTIDLSKLSNCFVISAHASVIESVNGELINSETAFAFGENEFPGNRWGWYLNYCQEPCEVACTESYAKNNGSIGAAVCFLEDGFQNWGWTNSFNFYELNVYQITNQANYRLPLFADAEQCDTTVGSSIGYVEINVFSQNENQYATIIYVLEDENLKFSEINLHLGNASYPKDDKGIETNDPEYYNFKSGILQPTTTFTFDKLNWPINDQIQDAFLISNVKLCAAN